MSNIVFLISGKSNSGKGAVSNILEDLLKVEEANVIRCSLSTYIRDTLKNDFYWDGVDTVDARKFMAETYRLGSIIYPYHMARRVWERDILPNIKKGTNYIIVESFREIHNYKYFNMLKEEGLISQIITIRVTRPNYSVVDEELEKHVSEIDLDDFDFDHEIINDGTIDCLFEKVSEMNKHVKMVNFYNQYASW